MEGADQEGKRPRLDAHHGSLLSPAHNHRLPHFPDSQHPGAGTAATAATAAAAGVAGTGTATGPPVGLGSSSHPPPAGQPQHHQLPHPPPPLILPLPPHSHGFPLHGLHPPSQPPTPGPNYHEQVSLPPDHRGLSDTRALPDPGPHGYHHPRSGQIVPMNPQSRSQSDAALYARTPLTPSHVGPPGDAALMRPLSGGQEGHHQVMDHAGYAHYALHDHAGNGSISNGLPSVSPHEQHAMTLSTVPGYSAPPGAISTYAPPSHFSQGGPYVSGQRRKQIRAAQACNQCRQRKQKCDEARPCSFCRDSGLGEQCHYREVPQPKQDRTMTDILAKLSDMSEAFVALTSRLDKYERIWAREAQQMHEPVRPSLEKADSGLPRRPNEKGPADSFLIKRDSSSAEARNLQRPGLHSSVVRMTDIFAEDYVTDHSADERVLSIPPKHTTGAHKLFTYWREATGLFLQKYGTNEMIASGEEYVTKGEYSRGLLRFYGKGEGHDEGDGAQASVSSPQGGSETEASSPAPSPQEGLWGSAFSPVPQAESRRTDDHPGGLNPDGSLKVDERTVRRLFQSYMQNMHILHPFLDRNRLHRMMETFIARYSPSPQMRSPFAVPATPIIPGSEVYGGHGLKRKRSSGPVNSPGSVSGSDSSGWQAPKAKFERSVSTALILLILALGKICEHKAPLPGPILGDPPLFQAAETSPQSYRTDSPPVTVKPSPVPSHSSINLTSPNNPVHAFGSSSRRPSGEGLFSFERKDAGQRNVDKIPGLAYFAEATSILGNVLAGNDLSHVQAFLLAGLYEGQLARVMGSWGWIHSACRACQVIIDEEKVAIQQDDRARRNARIDLIKFAFWTCLQLESDILAELNLPPSGISAHEDNVPLPRGVTLDMADTSIAEEQPTTNPADLLTMLYYSSQIQLRKTLNRAHTVLYGRSATAFKSGWRAFHPRDLDVSLTEWRNTLPKELKWDDSEPPAKEINAARVRAKYYGARYIINRPFLRYAIFEMQPQSLDFLLQQPSPNESLSSQESAPPRPRNAGSGSAGEDAMQRQDVVLDVKAVLAAAKSCVDAAVKSTTALDGLPGRIIVTNIFGTAHAQFGNMIVLAATYRSWLKPLIPKDELYPLLLRTINFLGLLAPLSPTMRTNVEILENVYRIIHAEDSMPESARSSFTAK